MFFRIRHSTRFSYARAVFLEPMNVRLCPRSDYWQKLHWFTMETNPSPEGRTDLTDLDGNATSFLWFSETVSSLQIITTSWVETLKDNPFDYILGDPDFLKLPAVLSKDYQLPLEPYLRRSAPSVKVDRLAREIVEETQHSTVSFLAALCTRIHESIERTHRLTGDPMNPDEVLVKNQGSCRDLTVLFMDACRSVGLPARFTSGYFYGDEEFSDRQMHAWAEVYLPGGGWRGYDPTIGLAVSNLHVAVASGPVPKLTAPTSGNYRGTGVDSSLDFNIQMETAESLDLLKPPQ